MTTETLQADLKCAQLRAKHAEKERDAANEKLADFQDDFRNVVDGKCATDERHCACVPHLRAALDDAQKQYAPEGERYVYACKDHAGILPVDVDECEVCSLVKKLDDVTAERDEALAQVARLEQSDAWDLLERLDAVTAERDEARAKHDAQIEHNAKLNGLCGRYLDGLHSVVSGIQTAKLVTLDDVKTVAKAALDGVTMSAGGEGKE